MPASIGVNLRVTGHCSQGGRKYMEDFFSVAYQQSLSDERDLEYAFIGIYDGHGGSEAATFAKEHLINLIVNQKFFWSNDDRDVLRAIREGYIATHYAMWREQEKWPKTATGLPSTAGTTASVAFIRHGKIYIGHVGDSGIVLGYQEDGEKHWRARPLTQDHKPECNVEKARIMNSGGKVVTKSGVPRVVWNRPRLGHKGPVRRSTPIDEIPFLAVARSLGDLWSYNSALNEFVVSPDPDVRVVKIDPKRFRCLIFGTDGLWNVLSAQTAVDNVRLSEQINERNVCLGGAREWMNPSKNLVDRALERWSTRKMRADNTSVVIIMLDPPGPPKRDVLKSCTAQTYAMDYLSRSERADDERADQLEADPADNFTMFDHGTNEHINLDTIPMPTSGLAIMTRYDHATGTDYVVDKHSGYMNVGEGVTNNTDVPYMNSFAESYNSLLNSSLGNDHSYIYNHEVADDGVVDDEDYDEDSGDGSNHFMNVQPTVDTYSLTKLQTRSEQQIDLYGESSSSTDLMYSVYQHNLIDHNYLGEHHFHQHHQQEQQPQVEQFTSLTTDYISSKTNNSDSLNHNNSLSIDPADDSATENVLQNLHNSNYYESQKVLFNPNVNDITIISTCTDNSRNVIDKCTKSESSHIFNPNNYDHSANSVVPNNCLSTSNSKEPSFDNSIQINEISSSDNVELMANEIGIAKSLTRKIQQNTKQNGKDNSVQSDLGLIGKKITRSSLLTLKPTLRVTRSTRTDKKIITKQIENKRKQVNALKATLEAIIKKRSNDTLVAAKVHKENISIVRKLRKTLTDDSPVNTIRTRNMTSIVLSTGQRMLRSQNAFTKDLSKSNNSISHQRASACLKLLALPSIISSSKTNSIKSNTPINKNLNLNSKSTTSISLSSNANGCASSDNNIINRKQQPKRLNDEVQIVKNVSKLKNNIQFNLNTNTRQLRDSKSIGSMRTVETNPNNNKSLISPSTSATTLRCKMMLAKKSLVIQRCNGFIGDAHRKPMITRRTRLHN